MRLRNKKTGEIIDDGYVRETHDFQFDGQKHVLAVFKGNGHRPPERVSGAYRSLAELNEEWEDVKEPKEYWWISPVDTDVVHCVEDDKDEMDQYNKEIGNYFETKEEAEKAVEKLKAWKRLKEAGLEFSGWDGYVSTPDGIGDGDHFDCCGFVNIYGKINGTQNDYSKYRKDLDLLFSQEDD